MTFNELSNVTKTSACQRRALARSPHPMTIATSVQYPLKSVESFRGDRPSTIRKTVVHSNCRMARTFEFRINNKPQISFVWNLSATPHESLLISPFTSPKYG
jgi:hypothetical protein